MAAVKIPYDRLSPEALRGLVEDFVTREGTDYGETEIPPAERIEQVMKRIKTGRAVIVFDSNTNSCSLWNADDAKLKSLE